MAENPSFPPVEEEEAIRDVGEEKQDEEEDELEDEEGGVSGLSEVLADEPTSGAVAESRETLLETLKVELAEKNRCAGLQATTALDSQGQAELKEVVVSYDFDPETSPTVTVPVTETQLHDRTSPGLPSSQLSTNSISKCISSAASPTVQGQSLSAEIVNSPSVPETKPQNSLKLVNSTVTSVVKRPISDGYNWRKYGQKQVKRPKGFRSYFKCTHYSCQAKKLEVSDDTGHIVEIVTRGLHDHDPPGKDDRIRTSRAVASPLPLSLNTGTNQASKPMNDSDPSTSSKECVQEAALPQERKRLCPSSPDGGRETPVKEEVSSEAVVKGRAKKNDVSCSDSAFKPGKKPKFVVHAAGDVGISADGYRWRKYGQKMVKGNPNPRNYYRCTSAGCPVRKHIETAVDNTNAVIIAYKGVHDHDMPVPKKRHGQPSAPLVAAAAAAAGMNNLQAKKSEAGQSQVTSTQWTFGTEGELTGEARELGGEKAIESARTLLSIGFEIKPC